MPSHTCIPCPESRVRCCICAGHQHGVVSVGAPVFISGAWNGALGALTENEGTLIGTIQPASAPRLYTRVEFGVHRVFMRVEDGTEVELVAVPAVPALSPEPPPPEPVMTPTTLWDHLLDED